MHEPGPPQPEWPLELVRRTTRLAAAAGAGARDEERVAVWSLLLQALTRFLRGYARRAGQPGAAVEDLADEMALEMLARAESGAWSAEGRSPGEVVRYLERAARNGWLNHVRRARRETSIGMHEDLEPMLRVVPQPADADPGRAVAARELSAALRGCIERLSERDRCVWFFRAYYDMSSREIAAHPRVRLQPAHVDVINQRVRTTLGACLREKGHELGAVPAGAFVDLWEMLDEMAHTIAPRVPLVEETR